MLLLENASYIFFFFQIFTSKLRNTGKRALMLIHYVYALQTRSTNCQVQDCLRYWSLCRQTPQNSQNCYPLHSETQMRKKKDNFLLNKFCKEIKFFFCILLHMSWAKQTDWLSICQTVVRNEIVVIIIILNLYGLLLV